MVIVGVTDQMERNPGSREARNTKCYSLGGSVFWQPVGGLGILSVTAWVEVCSGSLELRNSTQVTESKEAYRPALGKGLPRVAVLLWQERTSAAKLLQLGSGALECSRM